MKILLPKYFLFKRFSVVLLLLLFGFKSNASHLVGGDLSLLYKGSNKYQLTIRVFRDCENGIPKFNDPVTVGMFDRADNKFVSSFELKLLTDDTLQFQGKKCIRVPTGCTEVGFYSIEITLDPQQFNSTVGYYFSWERCCRNTIINNIFVGTKPGETGETWYMEIPPLNIKNSTPVFMRNPLTLLCINNPFSFNYDVVDADGDSLVYSLVTPLKGTTDSRNPNDPGQTSSKYPMLNSGPYRDAVWQTGYSLGGNMMDANPKLIMDGKTGQLTVTPRKQGVYVIEIKVEEYRKGKKLGEVRRDLQFTVSSCLSNSSPQYSSSAADNKTYYINATDTLCFPIEVTDRETGDSNYLEFSGTVFAGGKIKPPYATLTKAAGLGGFKTNFCWQTTCDHANGDTQYLYLIARDNGCPIAKISLSTIRIIVNPMPKILPPQVLCLDRVDANTLRINFDQYAFNKYTDYFLFYRINPDSSRIILDTLRQGFNQKFIIDATAFNHATNYYTYYFVGVNKCGLRGDPSYKVFSNPNIPKNPRIRDIYRATVLKNKDVLLEWTPAQEEDFKSYIIYRRVDNGKDSFKFYTEIYNRNDTFLKDSTVSVQSTSYCYRTVVSSKCGYFSGISYQGCNIVLKGQAIPFANNLQWGNYSYWNNGVKDFDIMRKDPENSFYNAGNVASSTLDFTDNNLNLQYGAYWYKIVAHEKLGKKQKSESNEVYLIQKPELLVPTVFTPDGDGLNDKWNPLPVFVEDYNMRVYNRWGELVFESNDKNYQWDGTFHNNTRPDNVCIWLVTYTGWDKSTHYKNGFVTTLR
ncbi:MAG: gliding motility-associated C-terminal domain-containing protein [Bacteroidetes bacterium]|nr:gliding motility-associated C-terminal domain-containing protein [Bacteroidota bacterium]